MTFCKFWSDLLNDIIACMITSLLLKTKKGTFVYTILLKIKYWLHILNFFTNIMYKFMSPVHAVQTMHEHNVIKIYIQSKLKDAMQRTFQQQTSHVQDIRLLSIFLSEIKQNFIISRRALYTFCY